MCSMNSFSGSVQSQGEAKEGLAAYAQNKFELESSSWIPDVNV